MRAAGSRFAGWRWALVVPALGACYGSLNLTPNDADQVLTGASLAAPDPAQPGSFAVKRLYYGSGTDLRRPEYRDSVTVKTKAVDLSKFVAIEPAPLAKERRKYWGFEPKNFPVNARVWYPEGSGPFPLVLTVHGNHNPKDFSDPGYGYLGELLASRGYIFASVDMNFINGLSRENDGRGIMLLEHVKAWKGFNDDPQNPFYRKVDLNNIALIGHSRGGEAVGHAAAFNKLKRYPDDATVKLDYGFNLKSIIAIAPVDGQYRPSERLQPLENINYLVFHGSHDGDVTVFHGLRQYQRLRFTDGKPYFKAAVYVYRANHGQWNTVWNSFDRGPRSARSLDLRGLLTPEEQRQFGKVYISAFLDATLRGDKRYLPMFRDHRLAGAWLPKTMYITRFEDSNYRSIANFEEDVDVTTGSVAGVTLRADSMATWRENLLTYRSAARAGGITDPQNNQAVWLGWNNRLAGADTTKMGPPASFTVTLPDSLTRVWNIDRNTTFAFLLAATDARPAARRAPADSAKKDSTASRKAPPRPKETGPDTTAILITLEAIDANGHSARTLINRYGRIRRPLGVKVLRVAGEDKRQFATTYEIVLQSFSIPLGDFVRENASFDPTRLRAIRFLFEPTVAGTVILDELGFSKLDPAFLVAGR